MTRSSCSSLQCSKQNECASHQPSFMHTSRGETGSHRISERGDGAERALVDAASGLAVTLLLLFPHEVTPKSKKIREDLAATPMLNWLPHKLLRDSEHVVRISEYGVRLFYSEQVLTSLCTSCTDRWPLTECCTDWLLRRWLPERTIIFVSSATPSPPCEHYFVS